ncbi:hypothetical protein KIF59_02885 [Enterobacter cloacae subsp. cloacae]|nr:hypothetical protein [Enterobacter cloacae subsp. cloacae]
MRGRSRMACGALTPPPCSTALTRPKQAALEKSKIRQSQPDVPLLGQRPELGAYRPLHSGQPGQKLSINVKLEKLANATMRDRVGKGDYDIAIDGNWSPDFADPYMFMNYWFESDKKVCPGNRSFYENKEVDSLLQAALKTTDPRRAHPRLPAGAEDCD